MDCCVWWLSAHDSFRCEIGVFGSDGVSIWLANSSLLPLEISLALQLRDSREVRGTDCSRMDNSFVISRDTNAVTNSCRWYDWLQTEDEMRWIDSLDDECVSGKKKGGVWLKRKSVNTRLPSKSKSDPAHDSMESLDFGVQSKMEIAQLQAEIGSHGLWLDSQGGEAHDRYFYEYVLFGFDDV